MLHCRMYLKYVIILTFLFLSSSVHAQVLVPPASADAPLTPVTNVTWLNNATYFHTQGWLYGAAWDDGAGCNYYVTDLYSSVSGAIAVPTGYNTVSKPDIVIGAPDRTTFPVTYYIGVVYTATNTSGAPSLSDIFIDVYQVQYVAGNLVTIASVNGVLVSSTTPHVRGAAHIDMVNKVLTPGDMETDMFFVAWEDYSFSVNGGPGAGMRFDKLTDVFTNNLCTNPISQVNFNSDANYIDVAGIERPFGMSSFNLAYFTYYDASSGPGGSTLYYRIYNTLTNTFSPPVAIDAGNIKYPRIDGLDPKTQTGIDFEIVYQYKPAMPIPWQIRAFNPTTGVYQPTAVAAPNPSVSPYDCTMPTIAATQGKRYTYGFWADMNNKQNILVQEMSWLTGVLAPTAHYYQANFNPGISDQVAVACTWHWSGANYEPLRNLICWYDPNMGTINFKRYSLFPTIIPPPFRLGQNEENAIEKITTLEEDLDFEVYPKPASNFVIVNTSTVSKNKKYRIMDLAGRVIASGNIVANKQVIDIVQLASGLYLMEVDGLPVKEFIKN